MKIVTSLDLRRDDCKGIRLKAAKNKAMRRDRALSERHALGKLVYSKDMLCRLPTRDEIEDVTFGSSMELEEFASAKDLSCQPDGYYYLSQVYVPLPTSPARTSIKSNK